jgi:NCS1 family nucleobase:cation symporter-1
MKGWYLKRHKQVEVESGFSDSYLGTTVGRDWDIAVHDPVTSKPDTTVIHS